MPCKPPPTYPQSRSRCSRRARRHKYLLPACRALCNESSTTTHQANLSTSFARRPIERPHHNLNQQEVYLDQERLPPAPPQRPAACLALPAPSPRQALACLGHQQQHRRQRRAPRASLAQRRRSQPLEACLETPQRPRLPNNHNSSRARPHRRRVASLATRKHSRSPLVACLGPLQHSSQLSQPRQVREVREVCLGPPPQIHSSPRLPRAPLPLASQRRRSLPEDSCKYSPDNRSFPYPNSFQWRSDPATTTGIESSSGRSDQLR